MLGDAACLRQNHSGPGEAMGTLGGDVTSERPELLTMISARRLAWFPEIGVGYFPVGHTSLYDAAYFSKYEAMAKTDLGRKLNKARMSLVARHYQGDLVDVGIGSGSFVQARPATYGYDVNPTGIRWLIQCGRWWNPYVQRCEAVSLWDVLEHIPKFGELLARVTHYAFVAIPVFAGPDDVLASKHYRQDEHCWYFTRTGFVRLMLGLGWQCVEQNDEETALGRESIASFAFRRIGA